MVEIPLLGLGADCVDALDVRGRTQRGHRESLSLAAREETGAVSPRQHADLDRDRADLVDAAAVHADAFVEDHLADRLLLDETEEALADATLASGGVEQRCRVLAFLAGGPDGNGDGVFEVLDPRRKVLRELGEDGGRRLGVSKAAMSGFDRDAEEPGNVAKLVRLEVRVAIASDGQGVEVARVGELARLAERLLDEAQVEAHAVSDQTGRTGELHEALGRIVRVRRTGHLGVRDAVHLRAEDRPARVHESGEAIDDLAIAHAHGADLDQVRHLGVAAGSLDVDDDELGTALGGFLDELEDGARPGLEVADRLGLADGGAHLILDVDEGLQGAVAEEDRVRHDIFGDDRGACLDHHDGVAGARDDEIDVGALEVADRGVDHEFAIDATDAHGPDGAEERDRADRQRARRGEGAEDVGLVLLVRGKDRDHDLDIVLVALGEERPDRAVGQPAGQDGLLRRARLALDEAAGDLAGRVHTLFEFDRQREEVEAGSRIGPVGGAEDHRVAEANRYGTAGEHGQLAGLDGEGASGELRLECLRHGLFSS